MSGKHRVAGILLVLAGVAACSSSDGAEPSPSNSSEVPAAGSGTTDGDDVTPSDTAANSEPGSGSQPDADGGDSSSGGTSFEQSADELLFDLPDGWSLETESFGSTLLYLITRDSNEAVEEQLAGDYPDAELTSPFFALETSHRDMIFTSGAFEAREDPRIQQLANVRILLAPSPLLPDSVWGDSWNSFDDVVAFAEWSWPGASEPTASQVEIAGGPGLSFFPSDDPAFQQFYYAIPTAETQQIRIRVFPSNSVHADDVAAIIDSIEKGAPGSQYAS